MNNLANDNITGVTETDLQARELLITKQMEGVLASLGIDQAQDPNCQQTPERIARMWVREVCWGKFSPRPKLTVFPNTKALDEVYTLGPIRVRSLCSHHFVPILGHAWVGILPGESLLGLSKFTRLTRWVMARPQIQEEATVMLAEEIEKAINPRGLAIVVKAEHFCMLWRGVVEEETSMVTSLMRGAFLEKPEAREEFFHIISGQGFKR